MAVNLPPEVSRILYVRNIPYSFSDTRELFDVFTKYGPVRQIRIGNSPSTRGTAYVVYEDVRDAKRALENLYGFNIGGRYLVVLYHQPSKLNRKIDLQKKKEELKRLKAQYGIES